MNDNELFELCKEVYERLDGWDNTEKCYAYIDEFNTGKKCWKVIPLHEDNIYDVDEWHPLYTSDYLLAKLQVLDAETSLSWRAIEEWEASHCWIDDDFRFNEYADTPLKALLKLAIALHKAGELPINNKTEEGA